MRKLLSRLFGKKEVVESVPLPHQLYPELLEWKKGDTLKGFFANYVRGHSPLYQAEGVYLGVTSSGIVIDVTHVMRHPISRSAVILPFDKFPSLENINFNERFYARQAERLKQEIEQDTYSQFLLEAGTIVEELYAAKFPSSSEEVKQIAA